MPSGSAAPAALSSHPANAAAATSAQAARQLADASRALWTATLSLMTAFMQTAAPAHRYLLARRIARNFDTLQQQDCFDRGCRATFARLASRWGERAESLEPDRPARDRGFFARFF